MAIDDATLGEPHHVLLKDVALRECGAAVGGDRDEMVGGLGIGHVNVVSRDNGLRVVTVLAVVAVDLHRGEVLPQVRGFGHVHVRMAAGQAVGEEAHVHGTAAALDRDRRVSLARVGDAAGRTGNHAGSAERLAAVRGDLDHDPRAVQPVGRIAAGIPLVVGDQHVDMAGAVGGNRRLPVVPAAVSELDRAARRGRRGGADRGEHGEQDNDCRKDQPAPAPPDQDARRANHLNHLRRSRSALIVRCPFWHVQ